MLVLNSVYGENGTLAERNWSLFPCSFLLFMFSPIERDLEELKEFRGVGADTPQYVFSQYKLKSIGFNF